MMKRMRNLLVALLALTMLATGMIGTDIHIKAAVNDSVRLTDVPELIVKPGETSHIKLSVVAKDFVIYRPEIIITGEDGAPLNFSNIAMHVGINEVNDITTGLPTDLEFDVKVGESAQIGSYPITINFKYYDFINGSNATASVSVTLEVNEEKMPAQLTVSNVKLGDSNIGSKTDISFTVRNDGEIAAKSVYLTLSLGEGIEERYTATNIKIGDLAAGETKELKLPISILPTASTGRKKITANFTYKTADATPKTAALTSKYDFYINLTAVASEAKTPKLNIDNVECGKSLKPGDDFNMSVDLNNIGGADARNIIVTVDDSSIDASGIIKNYFTDGISAGSVKKDAKTTVKIPLSVSKYAAGGLKAVKILVSYTDETGAAYSLNETVYVDVVAAMTDKGKPNLVISNVSQNPAQPKAGEKVEISFDLENKSNVDVTELKIAATGLSETTFIPVDSDPYQYFEQLKGGEKIRVTIPLIISKLIPEGLNNVTLNLTYNGGNADPIIIPVKNIQNDMGSVSKPKLIVSRYTTDVEELRAGKTFNFTFDLYNTNATVSARNITVTVTQPDNVFTVTQGSNSFFINKMDPGETVSETLQMKVKSDASTKAYQIEIQIEYEYDGAEPNPTTGEIGEKRTEKLNLQAVENSRPVVDNINVYSWEGMITVGNPATLSLEFYNMGRSPLNNVTVTVEGDFIKSDGSMYFIGNVPEGSSNYAEFEVIPNIEGTANGLLRVTFEDSNGDTVEFTKDFSQQVMAAGAVMPGGPTDGGTGEVFNPEVVTAKKAIVPMWAFILIQLVIFILFIPVTRKVILSVYKARLRNREQD